MKKFLGIISLCLLTFSCSKKEQPLDNSLLWEISGNGLEEPSYLFGTIHAICDASLDDKVIKALDKTSVVILELDIDDLEPSDDMRNQVKMKNGTTIQDLTTDKEYKALETFVKNELTLPIEEMNTIKPYFIIVLTYTKLFDCPIVSLESELIKLAYEQNEEVLGLETLEEQFKIFDDIPYEAQVTDLLNSVSDTLKRDKKMFNEMLDLYNNENISELHDLLKDYPSEVSDKYLHILVDDRNKKWIPKIKNYAMEQPSFFGVGAGHLPGKNGVINLLRKEGYTVKAVK
ncbi:TraB/GumN family protein [Leptobacterium flavescens]|uniref:TraB/GumN family protein n=1 Tax=Leptobacterium flavescens TaxID=472055 RepID=A0A6P0UJC9_9FLAO|nr:TraB/GumN family protein [Leptobacterium flavescens]NER13481.1 TraB/GumN family protein [Leptobacterium flavescens]